MKIRKRRLVAGTGGPTTEGLKVEVDVVIRFPEGRPDPGVTAAHAAVIMKSVRKALTETYPGHSLRGMWVHEGLPRDRPTEKAVALVLQADDEWAQDDPSAFVEVASLISAELKGG